MGCACCGNHAHTGHDASGQAVAVTPAPVALGGRLICADRGQMLTALTGLPAHIEASRAEPGCLRFDIWQDDDPMVWHLAELFADEAAFAAHQDRMRGSDWGAMSAALTRDFTRIAAPVTIRPQTRAESPAIAALIGAAFGGTDEARLVDALRDAGDLAVSLVAQAGGAVVGHVALSPLGAAAPAWALAPLAVHPAMQRRGIGAALVGAARAAVDGTVVVLGDPGFYGPLGFAPADLASPYAGPHLMAAGPALPRASAITHAPAFAAL